MTKKMQELLKNEVASGFEPHGARIAVFQDYDGVNVEMRNAQGSVIAFLTPTEAEELAAVLVFRAKRFRDSYAEDAVKRLEKRRHDA